MCQDPKIIIASFKGELCRCFRLCSSLEQTKKEIQFTLDLYGDNGNDREKLQKIADEFVPPQSQSKSREKKDNKNKNKTKEQTPEMVERQTKELFRGLAFRCDTDLKEEEEE